MELVIPNLSKLILDGDIKKALLCRHTKAVYNETNIVEYCMAEIDPELSEAGEQMAKKNRELFLTLTGGAPYTPITSTMIRAKSTTGIYVTDRKIHEDKRLRSANFGDIRPTIAQYAHGKITGLEAHRIWIGSESFMRTVNRVAEAMEYLLSDRRPNPECATLVIVAHEEILAIMTALWTGHVAPMFMQPEFGIKTGGFMMLLREPNDLFFTNYRVSMPEAA